MTILFCNIAWMKYYAGRTKKDPPLGGGGFPVAEGYCGEECNFVPCENGFVYGHFETIKGKIDRKVRIERLGAGRSDAYVDGLDVVWTAPKQGHDPRTVVGWWRNARLYRTRQQFGDDYPSEQHKRDDIASFRVRAHRDDVFLLEPNDRTHDLGRGAGWSGQASWWYADDTSNDNAARFVTAIKEMIAGNPVPPVTTHERNVGRAARSGPGQRPATPMSATLRAMKSPFIHAMTSCRGNSHHTSRPITRTRPSLPAGWTICVISPGATQQSWWR